MPELGYLTPTKDGKRNLPAGYFVDLATWQRINLLYTAKAKSDLRQIRYEAARPDLVDRHDRDRRPPLRPCAGDDWSSRPRSR